MIIYDASARRPCCAEAQARGVRGGGAPPGKLMISPQLYSLSGPSRQRPANKYASPFDGETPSTVPRANLPPHVFLLRSCSSNPTGRGRRGTPRKQQQQQQHDGVAHGSRAIHRGQGVSIKPFGYPPLSDFPPCAPPAIYTDCIPTIH